MIPFYIGTYTSGISQGIYRCVLDDSSGMLGNMTLAAKLDNPSFLTLHPSLNVLYACSEVRRDGRREASMLVAYKIEATGDLTALGSQPSGGVGPCFVSTDHTGKVALAANYASGSISSFPILADGSLGPIVSNVQHKGKSVDPDRQTGPHAHCILTDPTNGYACAVDLGLDQVLVYELDTRTASLTAKPDGYYHAKPGNGPRHLAFHPEGKLAFIIHEMGNQLSAVNWNAKEGKFTELATVSTLPEGCTQESSTAEVLVHPNGQFVYGSNRGHDSIALFQFDANRNQLTLVSHTPTGGKTPRNFRIDPTGKFLLAENQDSDSIVVFKVDPTTGQLTRVGEPSVVGTPACIKFYTQRN